MFIQGRKKESEYKDKRVTVQVTLTEKEIIQELASNEGLTISDYVRNICIYKKINELIK